MANMSYCRFQNTRQDMEDCLDALRNEKRLSSDVSADDKMKENAEEKM